eukprot:8347710-Pyramimonas_sp.AAC.2
MVERMHVRFSGWIERFVSLRLRSLPFRLYIMGTSANEWFEPWTTLEPERRAGVTNASAAWAIMVSELGYV